MENKNARDKIRDVAKELLAENKGIEKITVRQIADKAGVGVGLINYHFGSKDALLAELVSEQMKALLIQAESKQETIESPEENLQRILIQLCDLGIDYLPLMSFLVHQNIEAGEFGSALTLIPLLRKIYKSNVSEMKLRIIALQLLYPLQLAGISPEQFKLYSGIDMYNEEERNNFISQLIQNIK